MKVTRDTLLKENISLNSIILNRLTNYNTNLKKELKEYCLIGTNFIKNLYKPNKINKVDFSFLRNLKLGYDKIYFYIIDTRGKLIFDAKFPELEGKNIINLKDSRGVFFVKNIIKKSVENGEGFEEYYWRYLNTTEFKKKVTYFQYLNDLDLIVGVTVFYEDLLNLSKQSIKNLLKGIKFSSGIYGAILSKNNNILLKINFEHEIKFPLNISFNELKSFKIGEESYIYLASNVKEFNWTIFTFTSQKRINLLASRTISAYYSSVKIYIVLLGLFLFTFIFIFLYNNFKVYTKINKDFFLLRKSLNPNVNNIDDFNFKESVLITKIYQNSLEKIKNEKSLRELLLENLEIGVFLLTKNFEVEYVNKYVIKNFNCKRNKLLNKTIYEIINIYDINDNAKISLKEFINQCLKEEKNCEKRCYLEFANKIKIPVKILFLSFNTKLTTKNLIIFEDIFDQIEKENKLVELKLKAEEVAELKSNFIANMSHEVRTPLSGIIGFIDLLLNTNLDTKQKKYVEMISRSSKNLLEIINNILELSKIEKNKLELENRTFCFEELIKESMETFEGLAIKKGLKLSYKIDKKIPKNIKGDKYRLLQVISNLINNAIKFTESGEVSLNTFLVSLTDRMCKIEFRIKDTGIGIPEEKRNEIFEAFIQLDLKETKKYAGTGLGLNIAYNLVKIMGGELKVDSKVGKGSEFSFVLEFEKGEEISKVHIDIDDNFNDLKILVVEDDIFNQDLFTYVFSEIGVQIEIADNGQEALFKIAENSFDLIFMDVEMPILNGIETVKILRKLENGIIVKGFENIAEKIIGKKNIVIVVSGHADESFIENAIKSGFNDFIIKPIEMDKLTILISTYFKQIKKEKYKIEEIFDLEELNKLVGDGKSFLNKNINNFIEHIQEKLNLIFEDLSRNNFDNIRKTAHTIKGMAGNIRAYSIYNYALEIEKSAIKKDKIIIENLANSIQKVMNDLKGVK